MKIGDGTGSLGTLDAAGGGERQHRWKTESHLNLLEQSVDHGGSGRWGLCNSI